MMNSRLVGFEIHREDEINYAKPLARALLRDSRLSFGARGLFAFLWDLPTGWRTNSEHLASISKHGRDAIRTLLKELEAVGAMRSEALRDESGKMAGKRWILVSPHQWAIEGTLSSSHGTQTPPNGTSTERRIFRPSGNSTVGKSNTKVLQEKGSPNSSTTKKEVAVEEIDDLVNAAVWAHKSGGGIVKNEGGFRHKIRTRIQSLGASNEDVQSLSEWRKHQTAQAQQDEQAVEQKNGSRTKAAAKSALATMHTVLQSGQNAGGKRASVCK